MIGKRRSGTFAPVMLTLAIAGWAATWAGPAASQARPGSRAAQEETLTGNLLAAGSATRDRDVEQAANFYGRALLADPNNIALLTAAFAARISNGDVERALPLASRILAQDKSNELAHIALGIKSIKDRAYPAAKPNLTGLDRNLISRLMTGMLLAWATQGQGDTDGAQAVLAGISGPPQIDFIKSYHRALIADLAGKRADAVKVIKEAYETNPTNIRLVEAYARMLARTSNSAAAQKLLLDFTDQTQAHPIVAQLLKDISLGKTPGPMVGNVQEGAAEVLYTLATVIPSDQDERRSQTVYLQLALYLNPRADMARLDLGGVFQEAKNHAKAITALQAIGEESPLRPQAVIGIALSRDAQEQTEEAISVLRKLLDKTPGELNAAFALGDIYRIHKRFEEAAKAYGEGIAGLKTPTRANWRVFYYRGMSLERAKQWEKAEADFKKALELFPNQPLVLNYLGYSWVDMGRNLDEAVDMIKKAVDLRPDDGYIVDSLGWAFFRLGRFDEAVTELEKAVLLRPEDPTINDHLGDAYWYAGRKLEATFQWRHAKDLNPEAEDLVKIVKKLETGQPTDAGTKPG